MTSTKAGRPRCFWRMMSSSGLLSCVLAFTLMFISPVLCGFERTCYSSNGYSHQNGLCGNGLAEALKAICMGNYNIPDKRDNDPIPRVSPLRGIILGKREAFSYLSKRSTGMPFQGIICECCYNQCAFEELLQYCLYKRKKRDIDDDEK